jgi:hypothetical protein
MYRMLHPARLARISVKGHARMTNGGEFDGADRNPKFQG